MNSEMIVNMHDDHVFKKCWSNENGHECIVTLKKPTTDFISNESRTSVVNRNLAKFRCNGLLVVTIFDLVFQQTVTSITHKTDILFGRPVFTDYEVGKLVKPDLFNPNLDTICTNGIHYFLSLETAMSYDLEGGVCCIDGIEFDHNGEEQ
jgi:hypothetical protein